MGGEGGVAGGVADVWHKMEMDRVRQDSERGPAWMNTHHSLLSLQEGSVRGKHV